MGAQCFGLIPAPVWEGVGRGYNLWICNAYIYVRSQWIWYTLILNVYLEQRDFRGRMPLTSFDVFRYILNYVGSVAVQTVMYISIPRL